MAWLKVETKFTAKLEACPEYRIYFTTDWQTVHIRISPSLETGNGEQLVNSLDDLDAVIIKHDWIAERLREVKALAEEAMMPHRLIVMEED